VHVFLIDIPSRKLIVSQPLSPAVAICFGTCCFHDLYHENPICQVPYTQFAGKQTRNLETLPVPCEHCHATGAYLNGTHVDRVHQEYTQYCVSYTNSQLINKVLDNVHIQKANQNA
jgi:hypothetical protein